MPRLLHGYIAQEIKCVSLNYVDFGMENTSGEKPPPYEQTHNFTDYPSSHVDIDEVNIFIFNAIDCYLRNDE